MPKAKQIDTHIAELNSFKDSVVASMQRYANAMTASSHEEIRIEHIPIRRGLLVSDEQVRYDYVPHAFALCAKKHDIKLGALHTTPCYIVDTNRPIEALGCFEPEAIVLPIESLPTNCTPDFEIPGGLYATCTFAGSFKLMEKHYARILDYIHDQGYQEKPGALEFCLIGEYESNDQKEYVSRLEVPVSLRN